MTMEGIETGINALGQPTLSLDGRQVHSSRDPVREAQRLAGTIPPETHCVILFGFGLGYLAEAVLDRFAAGACGHSAQDEEPSLFILEAEEEILKLAKRLRPLDTVLGNPAVHLVLPGSESILAKRLPTRGSEPFYLKNPVLLARRAPWYEEQEKLIALVRRRDRVNSATKAKFARRWIRNSARNALLACEVPGINRLWRLHEGRNALLVAAGPSLDTLRGKLPALRERCVVVAVDTALRICLDEGCVPDYVLAVDPQFWNARHLDHVDTRACTLVSELALWPALWDRPWRSRYLFSSLFPLGAWIEKRIDPKGALAAGGSVATSAWDFCRYLGCKNIYTAGLDLAFPAGRTHVRGAVFEERSHEQSGRFHPAETDNFLAPRSAQARQAPARNGGRVLSDERMRIYASWFERVIAEDPLTRTHSLGDAGIAIEGLDCLQVESLLALPPCRPEIESAQGEREKSLLEAFEGEKQKRREQGLQAFEELDKTLEALADSCDLATEACTEALLAIGQNSPDAARRVEEAFAACDASGQKSGTELARDVAGFLFPDPESLEGRIDEDRSDKLRWHLAWSRELWRELGSSARWQAALLRKNVKALKAWGRYSEQVANTPQT